MGSRDQTTAQPIAAGACFVCGGALLSSSLRYVVLDRWVGVSIIITKFFTAVRDCLLVSVCACLVVGFKLKIVPISAT